MSDSMPVNDATLPRQSAWRTWAVVLAGALLLFIATASQTIQWQDYGQFVQRIVDRELISQYGLALAHPLHYWIGTAAVKLLPLAPPHAVAFVSALFGAIAVANVFGIVHTITRRLGPALLAAGGLALAHTWWRMSTMPECYTITVAALTAELWALLKWDQTRRPGWLILIFLFNGLGFANHNLALLTLPVIGIVLLVAWRKQVRWNIVAGCALAWIIGSSLYLGLIVQQWLATDHFTDVLRSALFGSGFADKVAATHLPLKYLLTSIAFTILSFPNLTLPLSVFGLARAKQGGMTTLTRIAFTAALLIHLLFVLRYNVIDQYTFLLPAYALLAIFAGIGANGVINQWPRCQRRFLIASTALVLFTPIVYLAAVPIARHFNVLGQNLRNKPYRDDYQYLFIPWGVAHTAADRMSRQAVELAGHDGVIIVEDSMATFAVQYQLSRRELSKVQWVNQITDPAVWQAVLDHRPVVLVPASVDHVPVGDGWQRQGDLYLRRLPISSTTNPASIAPAGSGTTR